MPPLRTVLVRQTVLLRERFRIRLLDRFPQSRCCLVPVAFDLGRSSLSDRVGLRETGGQLLESPAMVDLPHLEHSELVVTQLVSVPASHIVEPDQQTVIHDAEPLEQLGVPPELLVEELALLRPDVEDPAAFDPVEVFEDRARLGRGLLLRILSTDRGALRELCSAYIREGTREARTLRS